MPLTRPLSAFPSCAQWVKGGLNGSASPFTVPLSVLSSITLSLLQLPLGRRLFPTPLSPPSSPFRKARYNGSLGLGKLPKERLFLAYPPLTCGPTSSWLASPATYTLSPT